MLGQSGRSSVFTAGSLEVEIEPDVYAVVPIAHLFLLVSIRKFQAAVKVARTQYQADVFRKSISRGHVGLYDEALHIVDLAPDHREPGSQRPVLRCFCPKLKAQHRQRRQLLGLGVKSSRLHGHVIDADLADTFELKIQINRLDPEESFK